MALDFARGVALFMASDQELAAALDIPLGDLRSYRNDPARVPPEILHRLGNVLIERGKGMQRVGQMLSGE